MKLYCKDGIVYATHDDWQDVPASAYGDDVTVFLRSAGTAGLDRVGESPAEGEADIRPFAAPTDAEPVPLVVAASTFFERTTEAEADAIDAAMTAKSVKIRRSWASATTLTEGSDLWTALAAAILELFGKKRAAELLAV